MAKKPMNLLFVLADEMRGQDMHHVGNKDVHTPYMDYLASEGVSFTNAIANCPVCTPSRGTIFTGLHALRHGAVTNDIPIRTDIPSIGSLLHDAGYATGYIGKWHLDGLPRYRFTPPGPRRLGFDEYWAVWNCSHNYFNGRYYGDTPEAVEIPGYEPDGQTDLAIRFIERYHKDPFALVLSWGPPHGPLELVPAQYRKQYDSDRINLRPNVKPSEIEQWTLACAVPPWNQTKRDTVIDERYIQRAIRESMAYYYAAITALDRNLGRLLSVLERLNLVENTVVVFTSDHGGMHWSHGRIRKQQPWEESIRVPLIIRAPGRLPKGKLSPVLVGLVDLAPTLLDILGQHIPEEMDGISILPYISGGMKQLPQSIVIGMPVPVDGVVYEGVNQGWRGLRTMRYTYARWENGNSWVLYDNQTDPYQLNNIVNEPDAFNLRREMEERLQRQLESIQDEFLPWDEHVRQLGITEEWNWRERITYPDGGRQVKKE